VGKGPKLAIEGLWHYGCSRFSVVQKGQTEPVCLIPQYGLVLLKIADARRMRLVH
jgi:hypothetical protein